MTQAGSFRATVAPDVPVLTKATFGIAVMANLYGVIRVASRQDVSIASAAGGAFSPDRSLLGPAIPAFAIWSVIYIGMFGHAVRLWLPDPLSHARRHRVVIPAIGASLLNTMWIISAQRGWVLASAVVICLHVICVWAVMEGVRSAPAHEPSTLVIIDGTYGLYLGWLLLASVAGIDVAITYATGSVSGPVPTAIALALLVVGLCGALVAVRRFRGNVAVPAAFCWGLVWLVRSRSGGGLHSALIAWSATAAAAVVVVAFVLAAGVRWYAIRFPRSTVTS